MLVLASHLGLAVFPELEKFENHVLNFGVLGVFVFFCVSGYVIPLTLRSKKSTSPSSKGLIGVKEFWIRRAFRLWPMYFLTTVVGLLWLGESSVRDAVVNQFHAGPLAYILRYLSFTTLWDNPPHWSRLTQIYSGLEWTLAYEMIFYVACALVLIFRRWAIGTVSLIAGVLLICALTLLPDLLPKYRAQNDIQVVAQNYLFFVIGLLAFLYKDRLLSRPVFLCLSTITFATLILRHGLWYAWWGPDWRTFATVPAVLIFYALVFDFVTIRFKPLTVIGVVSYSTYLLHIFISHNLPLAWMDPVPRLAIWTTVAITASILTYLFIELPAMNFGRSLTRRKADPVNAPNIVAATPL